MSTPIRPGPKARAPNWETAAFLSTHARQLLGRESLADAVLHRVEQRSSCLASYAVGEDSHLAPAEQKYKILARAGREPRERLGWESSLERGSAISNFNDQHPVLAQVGGHLG